MSQKNLNLALRLADILVKLNQGARLEVNALADEFNVAPRTIMRDLKERLVFLDWEEAGPKYYRLSKSSLGKLYREDIERFANFASIQNLFPKIDREFFQKKLVESICVKGHNYEDISHKMGDFDLLKAAIEANQFIKFTYLKKDKSCARYRVEPYLLLNRSGIWYLIALDEGRIKTFSFSKIDEISVSKEKFVLDALLLEEIRSNDSIYYGNQLEEVKIMVQAEVAPYFLRRSLLPNQEIIDELDNGDLLVVSRNVNEREILSWMRYWIPYIEILSPDYLQERLCQTLQSYLDVQNRIGTDHHF